MPARTRRYPRFTATDEDGRAVVFQVMPGVRAATPDDPYASRPAPRRIVLEGGGEVERVAKGRYLTPWGEVLVSDDPDAP